MATIRFTANRIVDVMEYTDDAGHPVKLVSVAFDLRDGPPFPTQYFESNKLDEIKSAFEKYVHEAAKLNKPLQVGAYLHRGRSPNGFNKYRLVRDLNV